MGAERYPSGVAASNEHGQVLAPVLIAVVALLGLTLALTSVARANALSAQAQAGADAAALAALDGAEAHLINALQQTPYPRPATGAGGCPSPARWSATNYAAANDARLDSCLIDGQQASVAVHTNGTVGLWNKPGGPRTAKTGLATAELIVSFTIGDRVQTPPPNPLPTPAFLHDEPRSQGGELLADSGLLRVSTCGPFAGLPAGAGIATGVRAAVRAAEAQLGQPVVFRPGWTEPCQPPPETGAVPELFDQRSILRVEDPAALVSVLGPEVALCQPYPSYPDHFALAREPVCGGRTGVTSGAFPQIDQLIETRRVLVD